MTIAVTADSGGVRPWLTYYVIETYPLVAIPYRALSTSRFRLQYANTLSYSDACGLSLVPFSLGDCLGTLYGMRRCILLARTLCHMHSRDVRSVDKMLCCVSGQT